ncbi:MAG: hypothetical protein ABSE80_11835, partial [Halobacteriota archaeon]
VLAAVGHGLLRIGGFEFLMFAYSVGGSADWFESRGRKCDQCLKLTQELAETSVLHHPPCMVTENTSLVK